MSVAWLLPGLCVCGSYAMEDCNKLLLKSFMMKNEMDFKESLRHADQGETKMCMLSGIVIVREGA
ncbi:hypothetical protein [Culturomica massiliensis]|uniref:hypothetical protein n=1 Tax=Culturomica massiliensis TaxID=1841857 RepID=UPI00266FD03D|nr:hypothetical protein [Culturomica massiliensis]